MTGRPESALLTAVERSPQAATAHDRAGWVGLFTTDGRVEDPVRSRPHVGHGEIGRFYDTFIGPRDMRNGMSAVPATIQLSQGLIRNQRLRGTAGCRRRRGRRGAA
jgi:Nuclear transport factor 2 (NTF2) domain